MTRDELLAACGRGRDGLVALTLPGRWGRSDRKRLMGRRGPWGRVVAEPERGRVVVLFSAGEVRAYLESIPAEVST